MPWQVEMRGGSIFLPQVDLWCDARKPVVNFGRRVVGDLDNDYDGSEDRHE